jgi:hypothetical protein
MTQRGGAIRHARGTWPSGLLSRMCLAWCLALWAGAVMATPLNALGNAPAWGDLSAQQRQVLAPLENQWATMDDTSRGKWAQVATEYPRLSRKERERLDERLSRWAQLAPIERGQARARFQDARALSPQERQQRWEAYQALSDDEREDLARQAQRRQQPVYLPDNAVGPREASQLKDQKQRLSRQSDARKDNVVPPVASDARKAARVVTPATVRAPRGATTRLVNEPPAPALHQQTGLPKIATTDGFVDPVTLLPRRGAQSTGMQPATNQRTEKSDARGH